MWNLERFDGNCSLMTFSSYLIYFCSKTNWHTVENSSMKPFGNLWVNWQHSRSILYCNGYMEESKTSLAPGWVALIH